MSFEAPCSALSSVLLLSSLFTNLASSVPIHFGVNITVCLSCPQGYGAATCRALFAIVQNDTRGMYHFSRRQHALNTKPRTHQP
ncbi:hypothetical protein BKA82DRAFT_2836896 [Pisolithus tinctorius]|nr:hypothetical protein BKA82DRAFT_2836896 [Pisolithus tinctorius]